MAICSLFTASYGAAFSMIKGTTIIDFPKGFKLPLPYGFLYQLFESNCKKNLRTNSLRLKK